MENVRSLTTSLPKSPQQLRQDLGDAVLSAVDLAVGSRWDDAIQRAERLTGDTTTEEKVAISRSSLYDLIWNGELTPIHIGRSVRFTIAELERFVAECAAR